MKKPTLPDIRPPRYRSWHEDVILYHFDTNLGLPFDTWKQDIIDNYAGYNHSRTGPDPLEGYFVPDGDEIPPGRIEVGCLPNIYKKKGVALGFRNIDDKTIEWLCFHAFSFDMFEELKNVYGGDVFDKVATVEKGGRGEKGPPEHKAWYESVVSCTKVALASPTTSFTASDGTMQGDNEAAEADGPRDTMTLRAISRSSYRTLAGEDSDEQEEEEDTDSTV